MKVANCKTSAWRIAVSALRDTGGNFTIIGALALIPLLGICTLSIDIGRGMAERVHAQNVADVSALGAALVYTKNVQDSTVLQPAAQDMTLANGLAVSAVTAELVEDYPVAGQQAVKATVTVSVPAVFAEALGLAASYDVAAVSYASLTSETSEPAPCILALSSASSAIQVFGGATINATSCDVAAVGGIDNQGMGIYAKTITSGSGNVANNWGTLSADAINYAGAFNNPSWNFNVPSSSKLFNKTTTISDPLATNSALVSARSELGSYSAPASLTDPATLPGPSWDFNWSPSGTVKDFETSPGNYVVPAGNYTLGSLSVGGGVNVTFESGSTITVDSGLNNTGSSLRFGDVNLTVNGGFSSGPSGITMGDGSLWIGSGNVSLNGTNRFGNGQVIINANTTIANAATLVLGTGNHYFAGLNVSSNAWFGDGDLSVSNGLIVGGGSSLVTGNGNYRIGAGSSGDAITLSGSGIFIMGDGSFSASGGIRTDGGSRLVFGKTTNHYINGSLNAAGGVLFRTSRYTVNGDFINGTGGATWPYTSPINGLTYGDELEGTTVSGYDMAGVNVTFVLAGAINLAGGAKTMLIAPTTGVAGGALADILIESQTSSSTTWTAGVQNVFVGAVHLPNSDLNLSGGSTTLANGQCFMLIVKTIIASGGASTGSSCASVIHKSSGSSNTKIALVG